MLREITQKEALKRVAQGKEVKALVPAVKEGDWTDLYPVILSDLLEGMRFLVDEETEKEVTEDPAEKAAPEPENTTKPSKKANQGKRIKLDEGKIKALHDAGWSNMKIADEMGVSDVTISKRLKEMEERDRK